MRADIESKVNEIKRSLDLLRRHPGKERRYHNDGNADGWKQIDRHPHDARYSHNAGDQTDHDDQIGKPKREFRHG